MTTANTTTVAQEPSVGVGAAADDAAGSLVVLAVLGALFGGLNSVLRHADGPGADLMFQIIGRDWSWLLLGFAACWGGRTYWFATARGSAFIMAAVIGNYVGDMLSGLYAPRSYGLNDALAVTNTAPSLSWTLVDLLFWLLLAGSAGLWLAVIAMLVRRGGLRAAAAGLVLPVYTALRAASDYRGAIALPDAQRGILLASHGVASVAILGCVIIVVTAAKRAWCQRAEQRHNTF